MLQKFGCGEDGKPLEHDIKKVVSGLLSHYNRPCTATVTPKAVALLFRRAYREHKGKKFCRAARERVLVDARTYLSSGELPDYVMRAWLARDGGEVTIALHLENASKPLTVHVPG